MAPSHEGYFRDVTDIAGVHFVQRHHGKLPLNILETIGSGCAFLDFDGDGWLDILLIGQPSCALYRNRKDGTFEDVTHRAGLEQEGHWTGCAVGDFDNDGYPDLYVSGYNCGALYLNGGEGAFRNVTAKYGIQPHGFETSCGFLDATGNGRLDLYVARYVHFTPDSKQFCKTSGIATACGPLVYPPEYGTLYLNDGRRFVDVTDAAGLSKQSGNGLGLAFADYNHSGKVSIALANDERAGNLFQNLGGGQFRDVAIEAGTAFDTRATTYGGMGIDWGDINNDGLLDLVVGTYMNEPAGVYQNYGQGLFIDRADLNGVGGPTSPWVNFGLRLFDFDNDGLLDLVIANGHVLAGLDALAGSFSYAQPLQLFRNNGAGQCSLVAPATAGTAFGRQIVGRGLAVGDYDNDGGLDILVVDAEGKALLLHNEVPTRGNWIELDLAATAGHHSGEGAIIRTTAGSLKLMRNITTSGSYLSANPLRTHFGLGPATRADNLSIERAGGKVQPITSLEANRIWKILQDGRVDELRDKGSHQ